MQGSIAAILCAAGSSNRMGGVKKEYLPLREIIDPGIKPLTVLGAVLSAFASCARIGPIVITVPPGTEEEARTALPPELLLDAQGQSRVFFASGGPTRRASVFNALLMLEPYQPSHVLIHDGARPWIKPELIESIMDAAIKFKAVIPALPLVETPKELHPKKDIEPPEEAAFIRRHLKRSELCAAQTPQGFKFPEILISHEKAAQREDAARDAGENLEYTDDAEVWGEFIGPVAVIPGDPENRKITFPEDIGHANIAANRIGEMTMTRIGLGRDLHCLAAGRRFLLGGVEIPFEKGELGHSDGDVLAHAVTDALLGAAGLGDIGELFPPCEPAWKDADSILLLKSAWNLVRNEGWRLVNLDCTVTCEAPRLLPYRENIRRSLARALEAEPGQVFVKGKTNEGLGPLGAGQAVEALVVCLIEKGDANAQ